MHSSELQPERAALAACGPQDLTELRLDSALQLLERAGHVWPPDARPHSATWMQSLIDGLCELSSRDALTGLLNRRQLLSILDREVDRIARAGENALLLLIDIDYFKQVNDQYGHAAGDAVLQSVSRVLQRSVRRMDTIARIGGEEFAIVLPNCAPAFGRNEAERIRRNVESCLLVVSPTLSLQLTVSIGGAYAHPWVRSTSALWLERADQFLYKAKAEGRNCSRLEQPPASDLSTEERNLLLGLYGRLGQPSCTDQIADANDATDTAA